MIRRQSERLRFSPAMMNERKPRLSRGVFFTIRIDLTLKDGTSIIVCGDCGNRRIRFNVLGFELLILHCGSVKDRMSVLPSVACDHRRVGPNVPCYGLRTTDDRQGFDF